MESQSSDPRRQGAEKQGAEKMEAISRLASGVAHDFNNLLTVISGYAQMLQDAIRRQANPEKLNLYLDELRGATDRAERLTEQLLAFSRRSKTHPQHFDLNRLIESLKDSLDPVVGADIEILTDVPSESCLILADPVQIEQAITNLALAARDTMPTGGRLRLTTKIVLDPPYQLASPSVVLECSDTGHGISGANRARIFEPYFGYKPDGRGVGLGLATVYGIVKQSQGEILVESPPHGGTSFLLYFPLASPERGTRDNHAAHPAAPDDLRGNATVLLVEDDDTVRSLVKRMLERYGYEALAASGAQEAMHLFQDHHLRIGLLLTDIVMPETDGRQLARLLRQAKPKLKILYMSGYMGDQEFEGSKEHRADALLLRKPFTPEVLARHVRRALESAT